MGREAFMTNFQAQSKEQKDWGREVIMGNTFLDAAPSFCHAFRPPPSFLAVPPYEHTFPLQRKDDI